MLSVIANFIKDEEGQGLVEYALIAALIAVAAIVALTFLGGTVSNKMKAVGGNIAGT
ncbi:MAG: Flp family type IVb pilin [Candidatus Margulisiibacteriota bacterium]|nr:MAG: Flp family type IVb pilin [Candidatus Margulisiibacteriota bacterium]HAR63915.1 Flp family type IVb pilin [Candidatus Margulisiibacteriota bacterium]HCT85848.1 Flp family type IVb pilin [Candidatus Margulisiibacteriota bacterium]